MFHTEAGKFNFNEKIEIHSRWLRLSNFGVGRAQAFQIREFLAKIEPLNPSTNGKSPLVVACHFLDGLQG
jgi:hypothetical protein